MKKLKYMLAGVLVLTPLFSQAAVTGKTATGTSIFLPGNKGRIGNTEPGRVTPSKGKVRDDFNGTGDEMSNVVVEDMAFTQPGDLLKGNVNQGDSGVIVVGRTAEKEENSRWFQKAGGVAWKAVINFFPTAKADAFESKVAAVTGAFSNAIRDSVHWGPKTRGNLGKLINGSYSEEGLSQAIEDAKGIPAEDEEAQREWIDDMICKCNPVACAI